MKKFLYSFAFSILLSTSFVVQSKAQDENMYSLHAMFIHNFIKYTEWPSSVSVVTIGVVDNSEATATLIKKFGSNAKTQVKNFKNVDNIDVCQIIFIPSSSRAHLNKILEKVKGKPVLIVTEDADMIKKGASISFKVVSEKLKFQMNADAIKVSGLKVASSLTALAVN